MGSALPEGVHVAGLQARTFTVVVNELLVTCQRYDTSPLPLFKPVMVPSVIRLPVPDWNTRAFASLTDAMVLFCALLMLVVPV